jgi:outer membrane lipoprotein SlyB
MGGGNGKKAMTVLGAVGGGFAGHEVEKRARSTTVYQVRLRMDDGTTRTVTQQTAPAVGGRFEVEGSTLKAIPLPKA